MKLRDLLSEWRFSKFLGMALIVGTLATLGFSLSVSNAATEDEDVSETCRALDDIIRIALDANIPGGTDARVAVALAAHERLSCPAGGLLVALNVR